MFRMITDKDNPLTLDILPASSAAYSHNPDSAIEEVNKLSFIFFFWRYLILNRF